MTRMIEVELYKFEELSDRSKEKARDWFRSIDTGHNWSGEILGTLKAFCDAFPVEAKDWEYSTYDYSVTPRYRCTDDVGDLTCNRLRTYLLNNYGQYLSAPKVYPSKSFLTTEERRRYSNQFKRVSRVIVGETCCPLTGVCFDEDALQPIRDFIRKPDGRCFYDLLDDCLQSLFKSARDDWAYHFSDEAVDELIIANEYEFTADGENY